MEKLSIGERGKIKDFLRFFKRKLLGRKCCYRFGLLDCILL